jgi:hypothetical protein
MKRLSHIVAIATITLFSAGFSRGQNTITPSPAPSSPGFRSSRHKTLSLRRRLFQPKHLLISGQ